MQVYGEPGLSLLGDPIRQAIFELLAEEPRSVRELAARLPVSRPAVSHHLRLLKDGGLVASHADGTRRIYQLNPEGVAALRAYLDHAWERAQRYWRDVAERSATDFRLQRSSSNSPAPLPLNQVFATRKWLPITNPGQN